MDLKDKKLCGSLNIKQNRLKKTIEGQEDNSVGWKINFANIKT